MGRGHPDSEVSGRATGEVGSGKGGQELSSTASPRPPHRLGASHVGMAWTCTEVLRLPKS